MKVAHTRAVRSDGGRAFLPDPFACGPCRHLHTTDLLAEELGEDFVKSATSAENVATDIRDELMPEEVGGPFVVSTVQVEFGATVNEENPPEGDREAQPTAGKVRKWLRALVVDSTDDY